jgi:hypothetical protein
LTVLLRWLVCCPVGSPFFNDRHAIHFTLRPSAWKIPCVGRFQTAAIDCNRVLRSYNPPNLNSLYLYVRKSPGIVAGSRNPWFSAVLLDFSPFATGPISYSKYG